MTRQEILGDLLKRANQTAPDLLVADIAAAVRDAGGEHMVLYLVDYEQQTLRPLVLVPDLLKDPAESVSIIGTMAGRAFQSQQVISAETEPGCRIWAPVRERAEQLGVLELDFAEMSQDILTLGEDLGRLIGHLVRTAGRYTDVIELCRRRHPMNLPAEIQWDMLLPPLAFRSPDVAIAGLLEPAYHVGGDAFDYCLNGEILSFVMLDAMGHELTSTLASALALAGFRYGRRRRLALTEIATDIDEALVAQFDGETFVTGHLVQLDTSSGLFTWINAGHPDPLLVRGTKVIAEPHCEPCFPLGLGIQVSQVGQLRLEEGDRIVFYSDGVIEARPDGGDQFGLPRLRAQLEQNLSERLLPAEILRRIVTGVVEHRASKLEDDATLVMIEWQPAMR